MIAGSFAAFESIIQKTNSRKKQRKPSIVRHSIKKSLTIPRIPSLKSESTPKPDQTTPTIIPHLDARRSQERNSLQQVQNNSKATYAVSKAVTQRRQIAQEVVSRSHQFIDLSKGEFKIEFINCRYMNPLVGGVSQNEQKCNDVSSESLMLTNNQTTYSQQNILDSSNKEGLLHNNKKENEPSLRVMLVIREHRETHFLSIPSKEKSQKHQDIPLDSFKSFSFDLSANSSASKSEVGQEESSKLKNSMQPQHDGYIQFDFACDSFMGKQTITLSEFTHSSQNYIMHRVRFQPSGAVNSSADVKQQLQQSQGSATGKINEKYELAPFELLVMMQYIYSPQDYLENLLYQTKVLQSSLKKETNNWMKTENSASNRIIEQKQLEGIQEKETEEEAKSNNGAKETPPCKEQVVEQQRQINDDLLSVFHKFMRQDEFSLKKSNEQQMNSVENNSNKCSSKSVMSPTSGSSCGNFDSKAFRDSDSYSSLMYPVHPVIIGYDDSYIEGANVEEQQENIG